MHLRTAFSIVLASTLLAVACGGDDDDKKDETPGGGGDTAGMGGDSGGGATDAELAMCKMSFKEGRPTATDACQDCACTKCADQLMAFDALMGEDRTKADALAKCSADSKCDGLKCICGDAAITDCLMDPTGPCYDEVLAAGGVAAGTPPDEALAALAPLAMMPENPLTVTATLGTCLTGAEANATTGTAAMPAMCPECAQE